MFYEVKNGKDIVARVPGMIPKEDVIRQHVKFHECKRPFLVRKLEIWRDALGKYMWGEHRWDTIRKHGTFLPRSENKGVFITEATFETCTYVSVQTRGAGLPRQTKGFGYSVYGYDLAWKLAEFQAVLWRARNTLSTVVLPKDMVDRMTEGHADLFACLRLEQAEDGELFYIYDY